MVGDVLTDDWRGWTKEVAVRNVRNVKIYNALAVLIAQHKITACEARTRLKMKTIAAERTDAQLRDEQLATSTDKRDELMRYVDAVGYLLAGTSVWSASCPRYNAHRKLDAVLDQEPQHCAVACDASAESRVLAA
ncbi:hypothetical protein LTR78_003334 [Recurvomyces mirabilis]|uniref:Uncharacterized protein n=1 Tax=Recurvomyces mirabilis TaxID=574656 RepID=A0AAE0WSP2_9PEZI|nr:hypothetical protein LTR78_003334 [Recurvomyces mirabilis]KAK5156849.1 hypothetical protein LTS14_004366 [Recurvomyces mirabilis]